MQSVYERPFQFLGLDLCSERGIVSQWSPACDFSKSQESRKAEFMKLNTKHLNFLCSLVINISLLTLNIDLIKSVIDISFSANINIFI